MAEAAKSSKILRTFSEVISTLEPRLEERLSRSASADSLPCIANRSQNEDGDPRTWEARLKQVVSLSESTLEFLACAVKQHKIPLSPVVTFGGAEEHSCVDALLSRESSNALTIPRSRSSKGHDATSDGWSSTRRQLDKTFRSLATWRKDLRDDDLQFEDGRLLVEDVDGVFDCLLAVARQLVRLVDLDSSDWDKDDKDASKFKKIAQNLKEMAEDVRSGAVAFRLRSRDAKKAEAKKSSTEGDAVAQKENYFEELEVLVSNLKLKSEPLLLALRRRDWVRQAVKCREQGDDTDLPRKKPSSKA
ncbi:hypothetical protein ACJ41O_010811 [Fusarium nematophilum]